VKKLKVEALLLGSLNYTIRFVSWVLWRQSETNQANCNIQKRSSIGVELALRQGNITRILETRRAVACCQKVNIKQS